MFCLGAEREKGEEVAFLGYQKAIAPHLQVTINMGSKGSLTLFQRV